jgi:hypothetical protein
MCEKRRKRKIKRVRLTTIWDEGFALVFVQLSIKKTRPLKKKEAAGTCEKEKTEKAKKLKVSVGCWE